MNYYAHSLEGVEKDRWQPLLEHLTGTARLARQFGEDAGVADLAYISGLIHDLGKYSLDFQQRLEGKKEHVDHATAGAIELQRLLQGSPNALVADLLAYPIVGHHSGLLDYGDATDLEGNKLSVRLKNDLPDYQSYKGEIDLSGLPLPKYLPIRPAKGKLGFSLSFLIRMVYSALVDADFQETETFFRGTKLRGAFASIQTLHERFNEHLRQFDHPHTEINRHRTDTLNSCLTKATEAPGFFTLTVPTGGGKTLASMAFALNHAVQHGMRRVIYVIPFTSIIEQNAGVFKAILGEENVLEHHSNFNWEELRHRSEEELDDSTSGGYSKLRLAAENWDIPIVVTTNVQFFESLFASRSSRCRKLHNLAKSVIIFDEAQMFPREYLRPAMAAVWELVRNYGASAVFCTATQPKLDQFLPEVEKPIELAPDPQELFDFYRRVEIKNLKTLTDEDLLKRLNNHKQVLCIVNTRKHASGLYEKMAGEGTFHLSTLMCPAHRKMKLAEIRHRLDDHQDCRVISTSVMEAGIDIDFPVGYRALTGLDSINQAAGRINRNMIQPTAEMFIFEPDSEWVKRVPRYVVQGCEVTRSVLRQYLNDPISIPAIRAYFDQLYALKDPSDFDYRNILGMFKVDSKNRPLFEFATAADQFRVIEDHTQTVIVPFDKEAIRTIEELKTTQYPISILRNLQPYTVSIYEEEFNVLNSKGAIEIIADAYAVLRNESKLYDPDRGLLVPATAGGDGLFC